MDNIQKRAVINIDNRILLRAWCPEKSFSQIQIPAGIDIGAQTPEEIAVSIMAEIISIKNQNFLGTDKFKNQKGA